MNTAAQPSTAGLSVRAIARDDWAWIQRWFTDETLNRELGPLDEEWLEYVLADREGAELVVEEDGQPVALVGIVWGDARHPHGITDLAIDPARRRTSIGRRAVAAILAWPELPPTTRWVAFVDRGNRPARSFFEALGWEYEGLDGEGDDAMHRFGTPPHGTAEQR